MMISQEYVEKKEGMEFQINILIDTTDHFGLYIAYILKKVPKSKMCFYSLKFYTFNVYFYTLFF